MTNVKRRRAAHLYALGIAMSSGGLIGVIWSLWLCFRGDARWVLVQALSVLWMILGELIDIVPRLQRKS